MTEAEQIKIVKTYMSEMYTRCKDRGIDGALVAATVHHYSLLNLTHIVVHAAPEPIEALSTLQRFCNGVIDKAQNEVGERTNEQ